MSNSLQRITAFASAVLLSLAPAVALAESTPAGSAPTAAPESNYSAKPHGPHQGNGTHARAGGHFIIDETARLLNIDRNELIGSLRAGKTLPELAKEKKGWSEEQYIQQLSTSAGKKLDQAIADGRLTEDEAKKLKAGLPALLKLRLHKADSLQQGKPAAPHTKTP